MNDEEWEETIVKLFKIEAEQNGIDFNIENFDDVVQLFYENGEIEENTKEAFYNFLNNMGGQEIFNEEMAGAIIEINYPLVWTINETTGQILPYIVINPEGEKTNSYIAKQNGEYTFIVENSVTGKRYSKIVTVDNIDDEMQYYVSSINEPGTGEATYEAVGLINKNNNEKTTFEKIYIIYHGKEINLTDYIQTEENISYLKFWDIYEEGIFKDIRNTKQIFFIEKDNIWYTGEVWIEWET